LIEMLPRRTWIKIVGAAMLVTMPVVAPFGESFGVPRIMWEPLVGIAVFVGLYLLFLSGGTGLRSPQR
jgi:hypothetical protein